MRKVGLVGALVALSACTLFGGAKTPAVAPKAATDAVNVAAEAWNVAASGCLDAAGVDQANGTVANPALAHECFVVLQPVHDAIVGAQVAVSVWDSAAQANYPCLMRAVATGLTDAVAMLHAPQAVADAALVALQFGRACTDGGK